MREALQSVSKFVQTRSITFGEDAIRIFFRNLCRAYPTTCLELIARTLTGTGRSYGDPHERPHERPHITMNNISMAQTDILPTPRSEVEISGEIERACLFLFPENAGVIITSNNFWTLHGIEQTAYVLEKPLQTTAPAPPTPRHSPSGPSLRYTLLPAMEQRTLPSTLPPTLPPTPPPLTLLTPPYHYPPSLSQLQLNPNKISFPKPQPMEPVATTTPPPNSFSMFSNLKPEPIEPYLAQANSPPRFSNPKPQPIEPATTVSPPPYTPTARWSPCAPADPPKNLRSREIPEWHKPPNSDEAYKVLLRHTVPLSPSHEFTSSLPSLEGLLRKTKERMHEHISSFHDYAEGQCPQQSPCSCPKGCHGEVPDFTEAERYSLRKALQLSPKITPTHMSWVEEDGRAEIERLKSIWEQQQQAAQRVGVKQWLGVVLG
ncbi:hypothetical protein BZA05DRAFT_476987 [Tricharina praecox]|uniref:uncharacterized protein n=1 Tax=Tricharina praecox TaxID=43433 RepID=UPI00221EB331|nr:uncharacterized protein BZA05DRAFT_476987 [Tricharina praecox]KAI5844133.1 hypothetical protein BZA05DRAFT_476987 [Tricharina praecox]